MFGPDHEARRLLISEHQAELRRDALPASEGRPEIAETAARRRRLRVPHLRIRTHLARGVR